MKTELETKQELNRLESDERLTYGAANIFSNAPLALIQYGLMNQINTLQWQLGIKMTHIDYYTKKKKNRK
jgi:hypothetical protein